MEHIENEFLQPVQSVSNLSPFDSDENYENCPHCTRRFFVGRLSPHLKSCSNKNPYKKIIVSKKFLAKIDKPISKSDNYNLSDRKSRYNQNINIKENEEKEENRRKMDEKDEEVGNERIYGSSNKKKNGKNDIRFFKK